MIKNQSKRSSNNYPFAAVGVNLTLLLGELTMLRNQAFECSAAPFWGIFEHPGGFFEVVKKTADTTVTFIVNLWLL